MLLKIEVFYEFVYVVFLELLVNIKEVLVDLDRFCEMVIVIVLYYFYWEFIVLVLYIEFVEDEVVCYFFIYDEIELVMDLKIREVLFFRYE